ncbi:MAG: hypothetical protein IPG23_15795 [Burkholderiales bacterium]|nr:hypothetical protein [Burkholderiales bacterium]
MNALLLLIGWSILFLLSWPVALLALVVWPFVWLLSIPLRLIGFTISVVLALVKSILFLPARLLGYRS